MKLQVFTLRLDPETGDFDQAPLLAFLDRVDLLDAQQHFFVHEGQPRLCLVLRYREPLQPAAPPPHRRSDPVAELPEADRALFETLRRWRNERAKRDGRPAYVLFQNGQLALVARLRPTTLAALQAIPGIGDAKVRDYGQELLSLVAQVPAGSEAGDG